MGPGPDGTQPPLLWTENETNMEKLHGVEHYTKYVKDAFHRSISMGNLYTICICMYVRMYVCMYRYVCVRACVYVCLLKMNTYKSQYLITHCKYCQFPPYILVTVW